MYRVHVGYTRNGHDRWRYFDTEQEARVLCSEVSDKCGIILTIERVEVSDAEQ